MERPAAHGRGHPHMEEATRTWRGHPHMDGAYPPGCSSGNGTAPLPCSGSYTDRPARLRHSCRKLPLPALKWGETIMRRGSTHGLDSKVGSRTIDTSTDKRFWQFPIPEWGYWPRILAISNSRMISYTAHTLCSTSCFTCRGMIAGRAFFEIMRLAPPCLREAAWPKNKGFIGARTLNPLAKLS